MDYNKLATKESLNKTFNALSQDKGYQVFVVQNGSEALEKIKELIPQNASVINGASITLETISYPGYLKSGQSGWVDLKEKVDAEDDPVKRRQLRKEAAITDFYLGSVHALTEDGQMIIASNTGSQLPSITFNSTNLIFVVSTKKIVPNLEEGMKRLEDHVFPIENAKLKAKYGVGTNISKVLIFKKENPLLGRKVNIILVEEDLGY